MSQTLGWTFKFQPNFENKPITIKLLPDIFAVSTNLNVPKLNPTILKFQLKYFAQILCSNTYVANKFFLKVSKHEHLKYIQCEYSLISA